MSEKQISTIAFAGLTVRFVFPSRIDLPRELTTFLCEDTLQPDVEYEIRLLEEPLVLEQEPINCRNGIKIYPYKRGWLRIYSALIAKDGCQVACFLCPDGKNILYYPASRWNFYSSELHLLHLIGIEDILLRYDAFLLHSSVVQLNGQAVLFSGPSGIGKSTQAALWNQYTGADIINGDRCIIRRTADGFCGCGSPWAGTSGIYRQEQAPIKGIFLLKQSSSNQIRRVGIDGFSRLFNQTIVNTWNSDFVDKLSSLIGELLEQIPVYELSCRPDEEAVRLAYDTLFKQGGI